MLSCILIEPPRRQGIKEEKLVFQEEEIMILTERDREVFVQALLNHSGSGSKLQDAAQRLKNLRNQTLP